MIELYTPLEIIEKSVQIIETERKVQKLQQKELAQKAHIPLPTYKQFIYSYKISFENLIKLFIALRLFDNLNGLLKNKEYKTINEIKLKDKLPKRINK
jgi:predicted transcriptional regulator